MSFGAGNGVTTLGFTVSFTGFTKQFFIKNPITMRRIPETNKTRNRLKLRSLPTGIRVLGAGLRLFGGWSASEEDSVLPRVFLRETRVMPGKVFSGPGFSSELWLKVPGFSGNDGMGWGKSRTCTVLFLRISTMWSKVALLVKKRTESYFTML